MNEIKNNQGNINDLIFEIYNNGVDFLKNNKGVIAQTALGAAELFAGTKVLKYAKGSEDIILQLISCFPIIYGSFNILLGSMIRPIYNAKYNDPVLSNEKFIWVEQIIAKGIKDDILLYKKYLSNNH